jgi:hypothetical protein
MAGSTGFSTTGGGRVPAPAIVSSAINFQTLNTSAVQCIFLGGYEKNYSNIRLEIITGSLITDLPLGSRYSITFRVSTP